MLRSGPQFIRAVSVIYDSFDFSGNEKIHKKTTFNTLNENLQKAWDLSVKNKAFVIQGLKYYLLAKGIATNALVVFSLILE